MSTWRFSTNVSILNRILFSLENYSNLSNIEYPTSELHICFKDFLHTLHRYPICLQIYLLLKREEKRGQLGNFKPSIAFEDSELPKLKTKLIKIELTKSIDQINCKWQWNEENEQENRQCHAFENMIKIDENSTLKGTFYFYPVVLR